MPDDPQPQPEGTNGAGAPYGRRGLIRIPFRQRLPQPSLEYRSAVGKWLARGESVDDHAGEEVVTHPWWKVIWLTGVDYFSGEVSRVRRHSSGVSICMGFTTSKDGGGAGARDKKGRSSSGRPTKKRAERQD